jgi:hypothetical protein
MNNKKKYNKSRLKKNDNIENNFFIIENNN